eukprot:TRINITY_DN10069_c1_g1_i1.p1 TRINITY_DN10069_c1_g1~~TRINITY_DN10069_c1_g1_i1.p1  ORF type:complete len:103 (-),score=11.14 TRINITY_DN10069_c1_g1_i1:644-952(-)
MIMMGTELECGAYAFYDVQLFAKSMTGLEVDKIQIDDILTHETAIQSTLQFWISPSGLHLGLFWVSSSTFSKYKVANWTPFMYLSVFFSTLFFVDILITWLY